MLSREEKWIARTLFVNRLLKANGDAFQGLFWDVMRAKYGDDFVAVRPQGSKGDGGNDGYRPDSGHYFQVYGPVDPNEKVAVAVTKLQTDFEKVKSGWGKTNEVKAYSFVFNDKYLGAFRDIADGLAELEKANPSVRCRPYMAGDLEDDFVELPENSVLGILNSVLPSPAAIAKLDFGVLNEVIKHILEMPSSASPTRLGELPELDEKVQLNKISVPWAEVIRAGARQAGHLETYFEKNSNFVRRELRDHVVNQYEESRGWVEENLAEKSDNDSVFVEMRTRLLPAEANIAHTSAVDIILGFYFEACDIFDPYQEVNKDAASG